MKEDASESALTALQEFPGPVSEEFERANAVMAPRLDAAQAELWVRTGVDVARENVRSWEASAQYFKASPVVAESMPFSYFIKWAECGRDLCKESSALAVAYFQASPGAMSKLRSRHIESWAGLGRKLYKGTWKSSTLSCKFYETSPALLESLTFQEMERFVAFLEGLSHKSYDMSSECLVLGQRVFPLVGDDKEAFISLASSLVDTGWRQVKSFFEAGSRSLPRVSSKERLRFLKLIEHLSRRGGVNIPAAMLEMSQSLARLDKEAHPRLLGLAESLVEVSPAAMPEFINSCPDLMDRVSPGQLEKWFQEGVRLLKQNEDGGLAYFRVESAHAEETLEALSSAVEFGRIKTVMEMYCRALAGADVKLSEAGELVDKNIGWVSNESPSTEGSTVFVPSVVDRYGSKRGNFSWYKVVSTHQVAHLEFDSFRFDFERPAARFEDLRRGLELARLGKAGSGNGAGGPEGAGPAPRPVTDMQRFFDLFDDRKLALDLYTVVEDGRVDAKVRREYRGIKRGYLEVQKDSLAARPEIQSLPAREAMVEFLVRLSLQQTEDLRLPGQHAEAARKVVRIARRVFSADSTVEDVAEAVLRIYAIIAQIPNEEVPPEDWQDVDVEPQDEQYADPEGLDELLEQMGQGVSPESSTDEQEYDSVQDVEYRGDFKPELVQLLTELRDRQQDSEDGGVELTQEMLQEMLQNSAELEMQPTEVPSDRAPGEFADKLLKEVGMQLPETSEHGQGPLVHVDEEGGELEATEPQTFVYDEWDFRADDYKPRWCIVRQKPMAEGDAAYYGATLHMYGRLVNEIRRQFEMLVPEMFRKVRRLEDGEDIDIDEVIEAFVDIVTGAGPSDKLYWRRNKVQRDAAVVFLLDTSASTAEAIDENRRLADDMDPPDDPAEYMVWLRSRRGEGMRRTHKRIIDLEKEAVVLLINALEAIGDVYGIYCFSGYGRENVEFYTVKDIDESFSDRVKRRIDRIAPLHATRMGPAIRHASAKLEAQDARTKLLFLISDGRPQDRGYSREGVEKEYAVHDTRMALDEARSKDINAFCLTVDKNGHDYLKTMCHDLGYEVLDDIYTLPQRLLYLYRKLTM